jgi:hypothetical protein
VNTEGTIKIVVWAVTGLVIGLAFGLVWHLFEPSLALYFWPVLGAVIFGQCQHAYHSNRDRDRPKPPATRDTQ